MESAVTAKLRSIKEFIYNPKDKSVLGRGGKSWAYIVLFYIIFYSGLAAFFTSLLAISLKICAPEDKPYLTGEQSILNFKPGVNLATRRSVAHSFYHMKITSDPDDLNLKSQLAVIASYTGSDLNADCTQGIPDDFPTKPCRFPISDIGACMNPIQAMQSGVPCMYLRYNKIYGWFPALVNATFTTGRIKCAGRNAIDNGLLGQPKYYPEVTDSGGERYGSISNTQFPFLSQPGYQSPVVAVQFPNIVRNTVVMVRCDVVGLSNSEGENTFEYLVDGP